jgi:hypothetical protein
MVTLTATKKNKKEKKREQGVTLAGRQAFLCVTSPQQGGKKKQKNQHNKNPKLSALFHINVPGAE